VAYSYLVIARHTGRFILVNDIRLALAWIDHPASRR